MKTNRPLNEVLTEQLRGAQRVDDDIVLDEEEDEHRKRPWLRLLVAVVAAVVAVYLAGQTASRLWLEDLDERLLDAGAGTNAAAIVLEREQLEAFRALAFSEGFAADLARLDVRAIEERLTPVDANHGIPMIDIIDDQGRVIFAFRADGAIRPIYRARADVRIVQQALAGERDEYGERFTDLLTTDEGPLVGTAGPVRHGDRIVGALLVMTPLDELLSVATNTHGAALTAYSLDRGDPLATTTPIRPRTLNTQLRTDLARPENLPHATNFKVSGAAQREQIGRLVVRHKDVGVLGAALPDRSREVALQVMGIAGIGMAVMSVLVAVVVYAWTRDRYETRRGGAARAPLALPAPAADRPDRSG